MDVLSAPLDTLAIVLRLVLATVLGGAVGINRELSAKPAGLRTHALVSLGAALATIVGLQLTVGPHADAAAPSRILQGIVAGIGFIGGGVILRRDDARGVHGLTTAASIWVVSVTGVAVGAGLWRAACTAVALSLLVLTVGREIDRRLRGGDDPDIDLD